MALKITEMTQWIAALPRDAWLEIAIVGSNNLTRKVQVQDILDLAVSRLQSITTDTHTLAIGDAGGYLRFEFDGLKELLVDDESSMGGALPDDAEVEGRNAGDGYLSIVPASSNTVIHPPLGGSLSVLPGGDFRLKRIGTNEYDLAGDVEVISG
jgi:hypothetical protein